MSELVEYVLSDRVATITINRPERRNAFDRLTAERLIDAFIEAGSDPIVSVVILTGTGEQAFCAGADLRELDATAREGRQIDVPMTGPHRNLCEVILETYKPVIASLNGPAVAGGCELALACDLRIAADHAFMSLPEAQRGMGANFASVMLPRLVPRAVALHMLYTGEQLSATAALGWGLYNAVVASGELKVATMTLANTIAASAPLSLRRYKEMAAKTWGMPVASALRLNVGPNPYLSEDRAEGVRAFLEKRPPNWKGR